MAEYINREEVNFRCSYHGNCMGSGSKCERCSDNIIDYQDFMDIPTADVIERSKIDKAIKEIEALKKYEMRRFSEDTMFHKALEKFLEILKRNIRG